MDVKRMITAEYELGEVEGKPCKVATESDAPNEVQLLICDRWVNLSLENAHQICHAMQIAAKDAGYKVKRGIRP